jgi:two-component system, NtrC family, sensor kinase
MSNQKSINNLSTVANIKQKDFLANLEHIIAAIDESQAEYTELKELFFGVIEFLPNALWVFNKDGSVFLQNSKANSFALSAQEIKTYTENCEIEVENRNYIIHFSKHQDKIIVSAADNTESKRHERLIAMGQMAAHLAHEIRNPIGSVSILTSTLFNRVETRTKPIVLEIKKSIWRVERIVKATLLFSKGFTLNPTTFTVEELEDEFALAVSNYTYTKDIDFTYELGCDTMKADFDLLSMVLQNMLFNAIDAIEEDELEEGTINVNYIKNDNKHQFIVTDSGIAFKDTSKLFEAFSSTKVKGNGLGLLLSKQIIEAHQGRISLYEKSKGFVITIPQG